MKRGLIIVLFIISFFAVGFVFSAEIEDVLHLNIQVMNSSGDVLTGTFNFVFNISTTSDCANVVYSNLTTLTTDSRGVISYYLENVNLNFSDQYWLCYYRDGVLINASKIARVPYVFYSNNSAFLNGKNESSLDVNSSNYLNSAGRNSTQFLTGLVLTLSETWFSNTWNSLFRNYFNQQLNTTSSPTFNNGTFIGNVGIGMKPGSMKLSVNGSISILENGVWERLRIYQTGSAGVISIYNSSFNSIVINANGDSFFNGGRIGIGTSSPSNTLDVRGTGNFSGTIYINNATDISTLGGMDYTNVAMTNQSNIFNKNQTVDGNISAKNIVSTGVMAVGIPLNPFYAFQMAGTYMRHWSDNGIFVLGNSGTAIWYVFQRGTSNMGIYFGNDADTGNYYFRGSGNLILTGNGSVGIGTSSPNSKLEVNGNITTNQSLCLSSSCNARIYYNSTGSEIIIEVI
jgi:hypothetical protein